MIDRKQRGPSIGKIYPWHAGGRREALCQGNWVVTGQVRQATQVYQDHFSQFIFQPLCQSHLFQIVIVNFKFRPHCNFIWLSNLNVDNKWWVVGGDDLPMVLFMKVLLPDPPSSLIVKVLFPQLSCQSMPVAVANLKFWSTGSRWWRVVCLEIITLVQNLTSGSGGVLKGYF